MASIADIEKARGTLDGLLEGFTSLDTEKLARDELGTDLSFRAGLPYFHRAIDLYKRLKECDLDDLSLQKLNELVNAANATSAVLAKISGFTLQQYSNDPIAQRNTFIQQVIDRWENDYLIVTPVLAYAAKVGTDFQRLEREARGTLTELKDVRGGLDRESAEIINQMNSALQKVQDAAKEAGVAQHAAHFSDEADTSKNIAIGWLASTVIFGFVTTVYVIWHLEPSIAALTNPTATQLVQAAVPRLIIIFVLSFGLIWSARNFTSSAHNYVVNRHRKNALATFQTFIAGAAEPSTKDAVLMQATHAIFTPQDSGFSKGDIPNPSSQVVEVFRGMGKSASS